MALWKPQTARSLHKWLGDTIASWDKLSASERKARNHINPDEPIVIWGHEPIVKGLRVRDDVHPHFHIASYGGGGDVDDRGRECGHDGVQLGTMSIDGPDFLPNGRRKGKR